MPCPSASSLGFLSPCYTTFLTLEGGSFARGHTLVQRSRPCLTHGSGLGHQVGLFLLTGPEYKSMKSCIYIGMASDDTDISELVETIAVTAREIEENSRVSKTNQCFIPFLGFARATSWSHGGWRPLIHSLPTRF